MMRILVRSGKDPLESITIEKALNDDVMGTNTGNLIFSDATHKLLRTEDAEVVSNGLKTDASAEAAKRINDNFDAFVIPLANAFRPSFEPSLNRLTKLIEQLTIPVTVLGVGAQAPLNYNTERLKPIEPSVRAFVSAVLDRGPSIGVRGELTLQYLNDLGFQDVEVIGCPSLFMYGEELQVSKRVAELSQESRISVNASHGAVKTLGFGQILNRAAERYPHLRFVGQNLFEAMQLHWRDLSHPVGSALTAVPSHPSHPMYRAGRAAVFVDPITWINDLRAYDFSFGTRIHGNIAALLAGTPCTVLCHDSRTLELCRYFGIPHRKLSDVPSDIDPAELYEAADLTELTKGHSERFARFSNFLDSHGLQNTFTHGDKGSAFDMAMSNVTFPGAVRPWTGPESEEVSGRLNWLRAQAAELAEKNAALEKRLGTLTRKQGKIAKDMAAKPQTGGQPKPSAYLKARRAVGRPLKDVLRRS